VSALLGWTVVFSAFALLAVVATVAGSVRTNPQPKSMVMVVAVISYLAVAAVGFTLAFGSAVGGAGAALLSLAVALPLATSGRTRR